MQSTWPVHAHGHRLILQPFPRIFYPSCPAIVLHAYSRRRLYHNFGEVHANKHGYSRLLSPYLIPRCWQRWGSGGLTGVPAHLRPCCGLNWLDGGSHSGGYCHGKSSSRLGCGHVGLQWVELELVWNVRSSWSLLRARVTYWGSSGAGLATSSWMVAVGAGLVTWGETSHRGE